MEVSENDEFSGEVIENKAGYAISTSLWLEIHVAENEGVSLPPRSS
jgi:hypothetical protein